MENGSFHLDFADFEERSPLRKESHQVMDFTSIPKDVRKSSTVEALISQNEDLMARLKVTLRRLTTIEDENRGLNEEMKDLKQAYASTSDQMLVWREKERLWKGRNQQLENDVKVFQERFPDYEKMEVQIDRLKRYQERVKSIIKPYLQQLKDYAQSLHGQIQSLNRDLDIRDAQLSQSEMQMIALKEQHEQQIRFYEVSQNDLVSSFEKQREDYISEIRSLSENLQAQELKTQNFNQALERQDELENLVISLRRNKEDFQKQVQEELESLRHQSRELKSQIVDKDLREKDLSAQLEEMKTQVTLHQSRREELEEQLTSLRYMWASRCEENEKLGISVASLEKLNFELSAKLNESRRQTASNS